MLDETTCPVCGKELLTVEVFDQVGEPPKRWRGDAEWAKVHYLAHLAQTQALPTLDPDVQYRIASEIAQRAMQKVDNIPPATR